MKKITNLVLLALIALAAIAVCMWLFGGDATGDNANVGPMLTVTYFLLGLAVVLLVGMTLMNMGKGRSNSRIGLFVFGGIGILAVVIYFVMAKGDALLATNGVDVFENVFELKITDTMLYVTYFALAVTVVALLWGVVRKAIK